MINEEELMGLLIKDKRIGRTGFGAIVEDIEQLKELGYELGKSVSNSWIPCSERLPEKPEENPFFENKPLELYLVTANNMVYPFRVFWNGRFFTDGWNKVDAIAWMPLPTPYQPEDTE